MGKYTEPERQVKFKVEAICNKWSADTLVRMSPKGEGNAGKRSRLDQLSYMGELAAAGRKNHLFR